MVLQFNNKFFSLSGQAERLQNVGATLNAAFNPFSKDKVQANVENKTLKTSLESVANHPYVAAGLAAGGVTAFTNPAGAASVAKAFIPQSALGKVALVAAAPVIAGIALKNPDKVLALPENLGNFGSNVGQAIADPTIQHLKDIVTENPVISGLVGLGAAGLIGGGIGLAANTAATFINSRATKANTAATLGGGDEGLSTSSDGVIQTNAMQPYTQQTEALKSTSSGTRRYKKRTPAKPQNISQKVSIIVDGPGNDRYNERYIKNSNSKRR